MKYYYRWSVNLGINPIHLFWINVWIGDRNWTWQMNHPLQIQRGGM